MAMDKATHLQTNKQAAIALIASNVSAISRKLTSVISAGGNCDGSVKLTNLALSKPAGILDYAATTTSRHVCMADAWKARCVFAEV